MSRKLKQVISCQSFSPISDVRDGIIVTKDGKFVKLMEFSPINYGLRSNEDTLIVGNCNKQRWCLTVSTPVFQTGGAGSNPVRCSTSSARTKYTSERSAHR